MGGCQQLGGAVGPTCMQPWSVSEVYINNIAVKRSLDAHQLWVLRPPTAVILAHAAAALTATKLRLYLDVDWVDGSEQNSPSHFSPSRHFCSLTWDISNHGWQQNSLPALPRVLVRCGVPTPESAKVSEAMDPYKVNRSRT